ncbi:MAG: 4Fe-4S binding protein [Chloroflexi bacterium]|nr:4Fe-4S binding protein [Chloroflexota bacterium]
MTAERDPSSIYMVTSDCTRCGVCEFMCHLSAIREAPNQFVIRRHVCDGCGECVAYCPVRAIVPAHEFASRQQHTRKAELKRILGG